LSLDEELPERARQTIGAEKSMLTVFWIRMVSRLWIFCHKEIVSVSNTSFIRYWSHQASNFSTKSADIARRSLRLHFDNSRCHSAKIVSQEMTHLKCTRSPHQPYSPDLAITDFDLFGILK
jgi:hypothetical protein